MMAWYRVVTMPSRVAGTHFLLVLSIESVELTFQSPFICKECRACVLLIRVGRPKGLPIGLTHDDAPT